MWVGVVMNKLESEKVEKMSTPLLFQFLFKPVLLVLQLLVFFFLLYAQISCGVGCFGWLDRILRCGTAVFELLSAESYFAWPVQVQEASAAYLCAKTAQKWQW